MQDGKTIHSPIQMEHYKIQVKEKAPDVTGKVPTITLLEGYKIPLSIRNGLSYMKQRCFTDDEWRTLPKVPITSVTEWNPKVMDSTVPNEWYHSQPKVLRGLDTANYDEFGEYKLTSKDDVDEGIDNEDEYLVEGVHHAEIEIHLSNLIQHETLDDITVYKTNSVIWNGSTWEWAFGCSSLVVPSAF